MSTKTLTSLNSGSIIARADISKDEFEENFEDNVCRTIPSGTAQAGRAKSKDCSRGAASRSQEHTSLYRDDMAVASQLPSHGEGVLSPPLVDLVLRVPSL